MDCATALYHGLPQSWKEFPCLRVHSSLLSYHCFTLIFSVGWTVGWWSPTLSFSGFIQLSSSLLSILYIFLPFSSTVLRKFSALWVVHFGTGTCLSWWSTPGNRCHWPGLERFVGRGCAWVDPLWCADSFPTFLVLVESSYAGSILDGTKL